MFDFLQNFTKSEEEKRQEAVNAYVDGALTPGQRRRFEEKLAQDRALQTEVAEVQALKQNLRQLPRRPLPRNFTLDPALYGRPQRQPLFQFYPVLRLATVLTAFFFIISIGIGLFPGLGQGALAPDAEVSLSQPAAEAPAEESAAVEVTRVVEDTEAEAEVLEQAPEPAVEEAMEEEEAVEEEAAAEAPTEAPAGEAADATNGAAPEAQATPTAEATLAPAAANGTASPPPPPTATLLATESIPRIPSETAGARVADEVAATIPPQPEGDDTFSLPEGTPVGTSDILEPAPPQPTVNALSWLQIGLGIAFVILALLTFFVRRRL